MTILSDRREIRRPHSEPGTDDPEDLIKPTDDTEDLTDPTVCRYTWSANYLDGLGGHRDVAHLPDLLPGHHHHDDPHLL